MKKQKTLAVLLSAAMVAGAIPTAALAEVVGSNSDSGVKAAELSEDQEIEEQNENSEDETGPRYVLMNVPYDEVYRNDIKNDKKVDAVSSATMKKTKKKTVVNGTYHSNDGRKIKGAIIPVKVDNLSLLNGFKRVSASNAEKVTVASASDSTYNDNLFDEEEDYTYGLRHLENIWRGNELGIYTGHTKESHGVDASVEPYKDIMGKTIDKITYLTSAGAYEIDTDLYVPMKDGTQAEVADGKSGNGSVAVTVKLPERFDPEYQVTGLKTSFADGALTYTDAMPGKYTLTISDKNEKWADIEADFVLSSDTNPAYYNRDYSAPAVIKKGSADEADFANYLKNITKVSVNGKEYAASGKGAAVIVKSDGTIDLANSSVFDGKEPYTVVVTSTGYPDLTFEIKQVTYDSSDSDSGESGEPAGSSSKKKNTSASDGMTAGSWSQDAAGNWYFKNAANGKNLVSAWAHIENPYAGAGQPKDSWFHFDANGVMQTGWFKDSDGRWYFFNPVSDSTLGRMMTGWNWIKGNDGKLRCYYFEEISNGHRGAMYSGTTTPDGYTVDADGAWTVNGIVVTR